MITVHISLFIYHPTWLLRKFSFYISLYKAIFAGIKGLCHAHDLSRSVTLFFAILPCIMVFTSSEVKNMNSKQKMESHLHNKHR